MRVWIAAFLVFCILVVFSIPIFYESILEKRVLGASRRVASDLRDARRLMIASMKDHGLFFESDDSIKYTIFVDENSNGIFDSKDTVVRVVDFAQDYKGVKLMDFSPDGLMLEQAKKTIMINFPKSDLEVPESYIFFINARDMSKNIYSRITRVSVSQLYNDIRVYRYDGVDDDINIVFKEI